MAYFVYGHNGQKIASGLRSFWIDPTTGETYVVTASALDAATGTLKSTLRRVRYVPDADPTPDPIPAPGAAPAGGDVTLAYEVPA